MRVLVCGATATELNACAKGIADSGVDNDQYETLLTGVGLEHAKRALSKRLLAGAWPDLIVSSGLAGSLSDTVSLYSWVSATKVFIHEKHNLRPVVIDKLISGVEGTVQCNVVSSPELMLQEEQPQTFSNYAPLVVDMESVALAELAQKNKIPFLVLRMISDSREAPLPSFLSSFAGAMASTDLKSRVKLGLSGVRGAVSDLKGVVHIVKEGRIWSEKLRAGWSERAPKIISALDSQN